jgi:hypothetical protein
MIDPHCRSLYKVLTSTSPTRAKKSATERLLAWSSTWRNARAHRRRRAVELSAWRASRGRRLRRKARPPAPVVGHPQTCSAESVRDVGWVSGEERGDDWSVYPIRTCVEIGGMRIGRESRGRAPPPPPASHCTAATLVRRGLMILVGEIEMKTLEFTCLND